MKSAGSLRRAKGDRLLEERALLPDGGFGPGAVLISFALLEIFSFGRRFDDRQVLGLWKGSRFFLPLLPRPLWEGSRGNRFF